MSTNVDNFNWPDPEFNLQYVPHFSTFQWMADPLKPTALTLLLVACR